MQALSPSCMKLLKENPMNWDVIDGNWKQLKGNVKEQWGKLTDDHLDTIAGKRDQLAGKIQEAYGVNKDEAEKQIRDFEDRNRDDKRFF
jgi:uncharacterized protein YjbJ (UPF0337 family)